MNFQNPHTYNRTIKSTYAPSYGQYPQPQQKLPQPTIMSNIPNIPSMPQMSQMSQQIVDYRNKHNPYQLGQLRAYQRDSLSFKNFQSKQISINEINDLSKDSINSYNNANHEQLDLEVLISPIILKGYNILRQCQFKPEALDQIQERLNQQLNNLKNHRKNFTTRMEQLIKLAEQKYKTVQDMLKNKHKIKDKNIRAKSADNLTKKQIQRHQYESKQLSDNQGIYAYQNLTPQTIQPKKRRGRKRKNFLTSERND